MTPNGPSLVPADRWVISALGTPEPSMLPAHMAAAVAVDAGGCWLWQRSTSRDGYGWTSYKNRTHQAHRFSYVWFRGPVPAGLVLDHLCRVRHCVNPAHLEPVTAGENQRRSPIAPAGMAACKEGHELSRVGNQRRCLICKAEYERRRYQERKASAA